MSNNDHYGFPEHDVEFDNVPESERVRVIEVTPEGREGIYLADKESLKLWIRAKGFERIHSFIPNGSMVFGADKDVEDVLKDIDQAERIAVLTGATQRRNIDHALSLILKDGRGERLEMYDIGKITEDDLEISPAQSASEAADIINATGA